MTETTTTEDFVRAMRGAVISAYSSGAETYSAAGPLARDPGQEMTAEIDADPDEVARLCLSRQQAREGRVRWDQEAEDMTETPGVEDAITAPETVTVGRKDLLIVLRYARAFDVDDDPSMIRVTAAANRGSR